MIVLLLAVAPVVWLLRYVYKKDKYEKEPLGDIMLDAASLVRRRTST